MHDDVRHGTTTLFAALDTRTGRVIEKTEGPSRARRVRRRNLFLGRPLLCLD